MFKPILVLIGVTGLLVACATPGIEAPSVSPSATSSSDVATTSPTVPSAASTATSAAPTTPTIPGHATVDFTAGEPVALTAPSEMTGWGETLALPYGEFPGQVGVSPGGDGLEWGPSYGTQLPDGTWWILDTAHLRLAHYAEDGRYLDDALIPEEHLALGSYVQYQSPQALADGSVVLQSTTIDNPGLLRFSADAGFTRLDLPVHVGVRATDGRRLFGFNEAGAQVRVDPLNGDVAPVETFAGQAGAPYRLDVQPGLLHVQRGDLKLRIPLQSADEPAATVHPAVEAVTGSDGVLHILVTGIIEHADGEASDVSGLLSIDEEGRGTVQSVRPLTSSADPGDGAHLGIRLGNDRPWLMTVDDDALRVYGPLPELVESLPELVEG
ncbi:hypothetical protein [Tessaracoccus flavus]|uniref:DUF7485 domain-containing protein n=1 Tax=Tessaracoccus flavus TaxID=1610493 RepID=A0A1Q2CBV8_9ACTN|nr:hypothetical protein [Tessaracoccus flavus]AQP43587.1 hypothetical protein RPIT_01090 [Tessaracoccus flavus]SDY87964.1 hypothetical protein SAMN05428934_105169 [Tessaracoccus flavus]